MPVNVLRNGEPFGNNPHLELNFVDASLVGESSNRVAITVGGGSRPAVIAPTPTGVAAADTAVLQALVNTINASGGGVDVLLQAGTYVVNAAIGIITAQNVHLYGKGRGITNIDFSAAISATTCLTFTGSLGATKALTADTTVGGLALTCAAGNEAGLNADDYILVGSQAYYETRTTAHGASTGQWIGEITTVASTSSGTVNLREPLAGGYTDEAAAVQQNYKTTDTAFFAKVSLLAGITVEGITFIGTTGSGSGSQRAMSFFMCENPVVRDVNAFHVADTAFGFIDCVNGSIEDWSAFDCWNAGTGYGVSIGNCTQDFRVGKGYARRMRHAVTATGSALTGTTYGVSRRVTCEDVDAFDMTADGFKTHACAGHWDFIRCNSYGTASNGAVGHGFLVESNDVTITDCWAQRTDYGFDLRNETLNPTRFQVNGFVARDTVLEGGRYEAPVTVGAEPMIEYAELDDLVSINSGGVGFYIKGVSGHTLPGVVLGNVTVINPTSTSGNVYLQYCISPALSNIKVRRAPPTASVIHLDNCTDPRLEGWNVEFQSLSTGSSVSCTSTTGGVVTGGRCGNAGKGVNIDNACTTMLVAENNLTGCTTPIAPGTATSHRIYHNLGYAPAKSAYTPGASPDTFTNTACYPVRAIVSGGTVSAIKTSIDGTNFYSGGISGAFVLYPGDQLQVTYTVAPTIYEILPMQGG